MLTLLYQFLDAGTVRLLGPQIRQGFDQQIFALGLFLTINVLELDVTKVGFAPQGRLKQKGGGFSELQKTIGTRMGRFIGRQGRVATVVEREVSRNRTQLTKIADRLIAASPFRQK